MTYLSRSLRAVLVASLLLMAMPLSAGATGDDDDGDQENTVEITIRGGDASALAACLNVAREEGRGDLRQKNECRNRAYATGGSVILKDVDILTVQENRGGYRSAPDQENTVKLSIRGGDANALAACLNVAKEKDRGDARQKNDCKNTAYAVGGSVILKDVDITTVQENRGGYGSAANQSNTVNLSIRGGDANALAACLNVAKEKGRGDVYQQNDCENKAYAVGGTVVLKDVEIMAVQDNRGGSGSAANQSNTVNLTIQGGDANALATCLNVAKEGDRGDVRQKNECENTAYASGGIVVLKNVDITVVQANTSY